jgi:hypothetical protein
MNPAASVNVMLVRFHCVDRTITAAIIEQLAFLTPQDLPLLCCVERSP